MLLSLLVNEPQLQLELCHDAPLNAGVEPAPQHQLIAVELIPLLSLTKDGTDFLLRITQNLENERGREQRGKRLSKAVPRSSKLNNNSSIVFILRGGRGLMD